MDGIFYWIGNPLVEDVDNGALPIFFSSPLYAAVCYISSVLHEHCFYGEIYCLDRASALLAGLITYRSRHKMYVFDIKTWRLFTITLSSHEIISHDPVMKEMIQHSVPFMN